MKYFFSLAIVAIALTSCTEDASLRTVVAQPMPATYEVLPAALLPATNSDCNVAVDAQSGPVVFSFMRVNINDVPVAAPVIGQLTIDISTTPFTASCTNPYADGPAIYQNGQFDENGYLLFDIPFTINGQTEYVTGEFEIGDENGDWVVCDTYPNSEGNTYRFIGTYQCN